MQKRFKNIFIMTIERFKILIKIIIIEIFQNKKKLIFYKFLIFYSSTKLYLIQYLEFFKNREIKSLNACFEKNKKKNQNAFKHANKKLKLIVTLIIS